MRFPRSSGVLLHPTSLPGRHGIGELGPEARAFLDFLAESGQRLWQVLPLGPTGYGDSPYQCFSAFAGNPLLVDLAALVDEGWLERDVLAEAEALPHGHVDYGAVIPWKRAQLARAAARFEVAAGPAARGEFSAWCLRHAGWLEDAALFLALKDAHGGAAWTAWPAPLRDREPAALAAARTAHAAAVHAQRFAQWTFFRQWHALRDAARERGIAILGDAPIFVAHDSADVWAQPRLFLVDAAGAPTAMAGVPPDYFSETGQLWGNPLYDWEAAAEDGYAWWVERLRAQLELVDRLRLDHFIGFTRCWAVPAGAEDAREGRFLPGPGAALFRALEHAIGGLPIVAEDLGVLTPEVEALRDDFAFPGMKVLQFAFDSGDDNPFLPHAHVPNAVVYTGTHDNDTTAGWWASSTPQARAHVERYLGRAVREPAWDLMRLGQGSSADTFVAPAQDLLGLGSEARMNFPGKAAANWGWRLPAGALDAALAARLRARTALFGRLPG